MNANEKSLSFVSQVEQLASDCKAIHIIIEVQQTAMIFLFCPPAKYEHSIVVPDAAADDSKLIMNFVKSRLLQEEQRLADQEIRSPFPTLHS